jgi:hypothetical protein
MPLWAFYLNNERAPDMARRSKPGFDFVISGHCTNRTSDYARRCQLVTSPAIECALWQAPAVVGLQLAAVGALLSWCADSKKAPTKPELQLPIRRTRPVLTRPRSDNYDARLPRRRQSNIASSSSGSLGP